MEKVRLIKVWRIVLGIATEITMAIFIMAVALGLSWLIAKGIK
jgi:hypothetical protein